MFDQHRVSSRLDTVVRKLPFASNLGALVCAGLSFCLGTYVVVHLVLGATALVTAVGRSILSNSLGTGLGILTMLVGGPLALMFTIERSYRRISAYFFNTRIWNNYRFTFLFGLACGIVLYFPWVTLPIASYGSVIETVYGLAPIDSTQQTLPVAFFIPALTIPILIVLALRIESPLIPSVFDPRPKQPTPIGTRSADRASPHKNDANLHRDSTTSQHPTHGKESNQRNRETHQSEPAANRDSNTREYEFDWQFDSDTTFADVGGFTEHKKEIQQKVLRPLCTTTNRYAKLDLTPANVLLHGPPGTGKSHLASAVMGQADVPSLSTSGGNLLSQYINASADRVNRLFEEGFELARQHGGAIIFIDEIDSVLPTRGQSRGHREDDKVVNEFLRYLEMTPSEMWAEETVDPTADVVVIGATNNYQQLDEATTRSGRMDLELEIRLPDISQRRAILVAQLSQRNHDVSEATLDRIAKATDGSSAADLAATIDDAAFAAAADGRDMITAADLREALI